MRGPSSPGSVRLQKVGAYLILLPLLAIAALYLVHSTTWRMEHDVPLAHYSAFMRAEHGTVPYLQLFEISYPGTILLHLGITRLFGYDDGGVMLANLLWFSGLAAVTVRLLAPLGRMVGFGGVALFGVAYFGFGNAMIMQRDGFLILPVALALLIHTSATWDRRLKRAAVGMLLGCAASIKPHAGIAFLPLIVEEIAQLWRRRDAGPSDAHGVASPVRESAAVVGVYAFSFAVPCVLVFAWLIATGGFSAWLEMSRNYLPLYLHMNGDHMTVAGAQRLHDLVENFRRFGGLAPWFLPAGVGTFAYLSRMEPSSAGARLVRLLLAEAAVFALYPAFSGQFWSYHYMPFIFFVTLLSATCLMAVTETDSLTAALLPKLALAVALAQVVRLPPSMVPLFTQRHEVDPKDGRVDEIARFLQANLAPGDSVQPLDWTGGAVHAMLIARARLATRFMYDYHFYHHVSRPFIQELRRRFIAELNTARPRFIVEVSGEDKPWPSGHDTLREFPELLEILTTRYRSRATGSGYRILERNAAR